MQFVLKNKANLHSIQPFLNSLFTLLTNYLTETAERLFAEVIISANFIRQEWKVKIFNFVNFAAFECNIFTPVFSPLWYVLLALFHLLFLVWRLLQMCVWNQMYVSVFSILQEWMLTVRLRLFQPVQHILDWSQSTLRQTRLYVQVGERRVLLNCYQRSAKDSSWSSVSSCSGFFFFCI